MKVGDLVKWCAVKDYSGAFNENGIVIQLSRTGPKDHSALILFDNGDLDWVSTRRLEVFCESRQEDIQR